MTSNPIKEQIISVFREFYEKESEYQIEFSSTNQANDLSFVERNITSFESLEIDRITVFDKFGLSDGVSITYLECTFVFGERCVRNHYGVFVDYLTINFYDTNPNIHHILKIEKLSKLLELENHESN